MARNFKFTLAYDGADYFGWQIQPDRPTIQGILSEAIGRVTGEKVVPQGSGRTDTGVHALAQVASCAIGSAIPVKNLRTALNDVLPLAIRVLNVEEVAPDFHARHSAKRKRYEYRILRSEICMPQLARYVYHHPYPLDEAAMQHAAEVVVGEHDFTSFAAVDPERGKEEGSNVRTIFQSRFERVDETLIYSVSGSGFLHHMVRNLVGTFLLVGKKTLSAAEVKRILERKDRSAAGHTAPAAGLWMMKVEY